MNRRIRLIVELELPDELPPGMDDERDVKRFLTEGIEDRINAAGIMNFDELNVMMEVLP